LDKEEGESIWVKIKEQFEDPLVRILLMSAVISFVISMLNNEGNENELPSWIEPLVIFTILVLNACVGIYQDYDAEKALEAL
jgi:Ca2+-transporting ATPase